MRKLFSRPKRRSARQSLQDALFRAFVFTGLAGIALLTSVPLSASQVSPAEGHAPAPNSPAAVLAEHVDECWRVGEPRKVEFPGAAIVQAADGHATYTRQPVVVRAAFGEALASIGYGEGPTDPPFDHVVALCV